MKALGLEAQKKQLLKEIDNEELLYKMQKYLRRLKKTKNKMPCQYSLNELKERLKQGEQEAANDGGTPHVDFMQEVKSWL